MEVSTSLSVAVMACAEEPLKKRRRYKRQSPNSNLSLSATLEHPSSPPQKVLNDPEQVPIKRFGTGSFSVLHEVF
ncbi:hypothetical protein F2Q68_00001841 [Brassica cretica]|uniref:Uncharacterized protein n=1 Tax=Brassica cretica TaxID=69181 RepID=A0A8S9J7L5_BRACR|nr:hypothetical protein F2Q68_00001841 [Brassica cretica]